MLHAHVPDFLLACAIFFVAGMVKGVLGMGLPTVGMGLLGLLMPVPQAAALITLPSFVTNLWQAVTGGALRALLARLWSLQIGIAAGVAAAAWLPPVEERMGKVLLGVCLLAYGVSGLLGWRPRAPGDRVQAIAAPWVGAVTGVITALTGVFVLPAVPWLQSLQLDRHRLTQALGLSFTTSTVALGWLLAARGEFGWATSLSSAFGLAAALLGMGIGQDLRRRMSETLFRRCFFGGLVLLGAGLVAR